MRCAARPSRWTEASRPNSETKKAKSSRLSSRLARPMSVSRKGGSSIGGPVLSMHRLALTKEALMIGR